MNAVRDFHNKLLKRREIVVERKYPSNPGFATAKKDIAEHFKASEDCVVIRNVMGNFGSDVFNIDARIYDSVEALQKVEPKPKVKKLEAGK
mgnify:CR=1 FL=1